MSSDFIEEREQHLRDMEIAVREKRALPLLPEHSIYLHVAAKRGGKEFVRQFRSAWKMLPSPVRDKLLAYWQRTIPKGMPHIEYGNAWSPKKQGSLAATTGDGSELQFPAREFREAEVWERQWRIGHELAHAYLWACGLQMEFKPDGYYRHADGREIGGISELENLVNSIAREWGFTRDMDEFVLQSKGR